MHVACVHLLCMAATQHINLRYIIAASQLYSIQFPWISDKACELQPSIMADNYHSLKDGSIGCSYDIVVFSYVYNLK